ncbi:hypothetical protein ABWED_0140 [Acinetobacter lwoffii]|nr:hypothetical protein ABWED_0140 [Acinetobacter lwoffii]
MLFKFPDPPLIVKDYLESIKNNEPLNSDYKIQGIQFSLIALGKQ